MLPSIDNLQSLFSQKDLIELIIGFIATLLGAIFFYIKILRRKKDFPQNDQLTNPKKYSFPLPKGDGMYETYYYAQNVWDKEILKFKKKREGDFEIIEQESEDETEDENQVENKNAILRIVNREKKREKRKKTHKKLEPIFDEVLVEKLNLLYQKQELTVISRDKKLISSEIASISYSFIEALKYNNITFTATQEKIIEKTQEEFVKSEIDGEKEYFLNRSGIILIDKEFNIYEEIDRIKLQTNLKISEYSDKSISFQASFSKSQLMADFNMMKRRNLYLVGEIANKPSEKSEGDIILEVSVVPFLIISS